MIEVVVPATLRRERLWKSSTQTCGRSAPLLSQNFFFRIPEYQRPFSWDADNFEDLVDDIITANKDQEYFLGTIVLHNRGQYFDLVDGQQRMTSIMILLACLRDLVNDEDFKAAIQDKILQRKNVADGIPEKIRLEVKDREIFSKLVVSPSGTALLLDEAGLPEPEWRYANAVLIFRSRLQKLEQPEIERVITFISQRCVVIYVATSAFDDAFRLFTIVNDRGKQLRRIDVLRRSTSHPMSSQRRLFETRLRTNGKTLKKHSAKQRLKRYFASSG